MTDIITLAPTARHNRHQDLDAVYHLYNRVAHSVRFLEDEEKDDHLDRMYNIGMFMKIVKENFTGGYVNRTDVSDTIVR